MALLATTALQDGFPYPTHWRKGCRDWNPDSLIGKVPENPTTSPQILQAVELIGNIEGSALLETNLHGYPKFLSKLGAQLA